jgi:predicted nuclease of predicted toxin-antitoxin system
MRKSLLGSLAVLLAIGLLVGLLLAGCGGSSTSGTATSSGSLNAKRILEQSSKKMQAVKTAKATGSYKLAGTPATGTSSPSGAQNMEFSYQMEMDVSNPDKPEMHMVMKGQGQTTDLYITGGFVYMNVPGKGWVKTPAGTTSEGMAQATPAEITQFANNAENLKIISEDADSYKLSFDIGKKYIQDQLKKEQGGTNLGPDVEKLMNQMINNMKMTAVFTINKATSYIENVDLVMSIKNMPAVGDMNLAMSMAFSDFNKPVAVALPAGAANAQEMSELPSGTNGGIPTIPGLGL